MKFNSNDVFVNVFLSGVVGSGICVVVGMVGGSFFNI